MVWRDSAGALYSDSQSDILYSSFHLSISCTDRRRKPSHGSICALSALTLTASKTTISTCSVHTLLVFIRQPPELQIMWISYSKAVYLMPHVEGFQYYHQRQVLLTIISMINLLLKVVMHYSMLTKEATGYFGSVISLSCHIIGLCTLEVKLRKAETKSSDLCCLWEELWGLYFEAEYVISDATLGLTLIFWRYDRCSSLILG